MSVFKFSNSCPDCCSGSPITITITVSACCSVSILGLTVDVYSGSTLIATGTTNSGGVATLTLPSAGTYTVTVSSGTTVIYSNSLYLPTSSTLVLNHCVDVVVYLCSNPILCISTVTVKQHSTGATLCSFSTTKTSGSPNFCAVVPAISGGDSYDFVVTGTRLTTQTVNSSTGTGVSITMLPATGYAVFGGKSTSCNLIAPNTLYGTVDGHAVTLVNSAGQCNGNWQGCFTDSVNGCTFNITTEGCGDITSCFFNQVETTVTVPFHCLFTGVQVGGFGISYNASPYGPPFAGCAAYGTSSCNSGSPYFCSIDCAVETSLNCDSTGVWWSGCAGRVDATPYGSLTTSGTTFTTCQPLACSGGLFVPFDGGYLYYSTWTVSE